MSSKTSENMQWHFKKHVSDGNLRHPADSRAWKEFDDCHYNFASDPRNVDRVNERIDDLDLRVLLRGPNPVAFSYHGFNINGFAFRTIHPISDDQPLTSASFQPSTSTFFQLHSQENDRLLPDLEDA
ncbi:hypothetical protein ZIOFF_028333 [Zingiber officinale]|uniref:Uncharacterized protein n=1 Tax=Zingiber officinale TaxID=94328 RepID=A0A8J5GRW4_ZINOF|nr:hypothetical protein ZIOFF_028333 [Zingiber officinale]